MSFLCPLLITGAFRWRHIATSPHLGLDGDVMTQPVYNQSCGEQWSLAGVIIEASKFGFFLRLKAFLRGGCGQTGEV